MRAEDWNEGEEGERRGNQRGDNTAGGRLRRGAPVDRTAQKILTKGEVFPAENLLSSQTHRCSHHQTTAPHPHPPNTGSVKGVVELATKYKPRDADMPSYSKCYVIWLVSDAFPRCFVEDVINFS